MNRDLIVTAALIGFVLALSACGGGGPSTELDVTMTDFQFIPNTFSVPAGQTITVNATNNGAVVHDLVIMNYGTTVGDNYNDADAPNVFWKIELQPGNRTTTSFTAPEQPGAYQVVCGTPGHIAAGMIAKLTVVAREPMQPITSLSNPLVKQARSLRNRKARAETGLFLVEGIRPVGAAVEAGWDIEVIFHAPELLDGEFAGDLIARAQGLPTHIQPVSAKVMESFAEKENPQGILAVVRQRRTRLEELPHFQRGVALVSPQDPGNVGAILRTMDAVGAEVLFLLDGGVDAFHPTAVRASTGSLFWKTVVETRYAELLRMARASEYQLIGTTSHGERDGARAAPRLPWIVLLGSEQKGLSGEQLHDCDLTISLPMRGHASSLNLAVAAGVVLYHLTGQ